MLGDNEALGDIEGLADGEGKEIYLQRYWD